jgi:hypothetical protein
MLRLLSKSIRSFSTSAEDTLLLSRVLSLLNMKKAVINNEIKETEV